MGHEERRAGFVDVFRGLLIAHMALDHASLMFNSGRGGEELYRAQPAFPADLLQFLVRFTGVQVAPGFFFMAGFMVAWTSAARAGRGVSEGDVTRRLMTRGLVLIGVDTVVFGIPRALGGFYSFMVLSSIGVSLMALAWLRRLPPRVLLVVALAVLLLHPLLDVSALPVPLRAVLYEPVRAGWFRSMYPVIPWMGLVLLGFVVGRDAVSRTNRERFWLAMSALCLVCFFVIRTWGGYGNAYPTADIGSREFWYFAKYPPDLPFLGWALALTFLTLAAIQWICRDGVPSALKPLVVFGRVSFFFYVTHFFLLGIVRGLTAAIFHWRTGLGGTLLLWLGLLVVMLPLCSWYCRLKLERPIVFTGYL
jgi:uncharacterized membrane protein